MLLAIPLLFIPVVVYAIIIGFGVLGSGGVAAAELALGDPLFSIPMVSGTAWNVGTGDLILFLSLILLFRTLHSNGFGGIYADEETQDIQRFDV